jgi:hypothetical protein
MSHRSDSEEDTSRTEEAPTLEQESAQLLTRFNFYWLKFLSQKRVIDQERKFIQERLGTLETEQKINSTRTAINDLSSS